MATKRTTADSAVDPAAESTVETAAGDEPHVEPAAISTKETDFVGRALITPGTVSKDYLGRLTTATTDHLGRLLLDV